MLLHARLHRHKACTLERGGDNVDELQSVLAFTRDITSRLSVKEVIASSVVQVRRILQPDHVFFFLKEDDTLRLVSSWRTSGWLGGMSLKDFRSTPPCPPQ